MKKGGDGEKLMLILVNYNDEINNQEIIPMLQ